MPLNSIMFLLIPCLIYGQAYEKGTLNSIMFLLIRLLNAYPITKFCSLNSIMFLLIQISKKEQKNNKHIFKFHYVSINSPVSVP